MRRLRIGAILAVAVLPALAAAESLTLAEGVPSHEGVDSIYEQFSRGYATLDAASVASLYTEDALYLSPGSEIDRGRDLVLEGFSGMFERNRERGHTLEIAFEIVSRDVSESLVADVGVFTLVYRDGDRVASRSFGKFVTVAVSDEEGVWRFRVDGYSSIDRTE